METGEERKASTAVLVSEEKIEYNAHSTARTKCKPSKQAPKKV
jgi:hypothetical protein